MTRTPDSRAWRSYAITNPDTPPFTVNLKGRERWALERLMEAGAEGCTPITRPAPRWSAYVFNLRQMGIAVETVYEPHAGPYPGTHGRYVLRAKVAPLPQGCRKGQTP